MAFFGNGIMVKMRVVVLMRSVKRWISVLRFTHSFGTKLFSLLYYHGIHVSNVTLLFELFRSVMMRTGVTFTLNTLEPTLGGTASKHL